MSMTIINHANKAVPCPGELHLKFATTFRSLTHTEYKQMLSLECLTIKELVSYVKSHLTANECIVILSHIFDNEGGVYEF